MSDAGSQHNKLAVEFVMMAGKNTNSHAELMVVIESTMLASINLMTAIYEIPPSHASVYMEAALQRATERFAAINIKPQ